MEERSRKCSELENEFSHETRRKSGSAMPPGGKSAPRSTRVKLSCDSTAAHPVKHENDFCFPARLRCRLQEIKISRIKNIF